MMFFIICGEDCKYLSSNSSRPPRSSEKKEWLKNGGKNIFFDSVCVSLVAKWWLFLDFTQKTLLLLRISSGWMLFGGLHVIRADSRKEKTDKGF